MGTKIIFTKSIDTKEVYPNVYAVLLRGVAGENMATNLQYLELVKEFTLEGAIDVACQSLLLKMPTAKGIHLEMHVRKTFDDLFPSVLVEENPRLENLSKKLNEIIEKIVTTGNQKLYKQYQELFTVEEKKFIADKLQGRVAT